MSAETKIVLKYSGSDKNAIVSPPAISIKWLTMPVDGESKLLIIPTTTTQDIKCGK